MKISGNLSNQLPFFKSLKIQKLVDSIDQNEKLINVKGLYGSSKSFFVSELNRISKKNIVWILDDKENAAYHFNDLESFVEKSSCVFFQIVIKGI